MPILGDGQGVFKLDDSDKFVGSFLRKPDLALIINIPIKSFDDIEFVNIQDDVVIDEIKFAKLWYKNKIPGAPALSRISLDEFIIKALINKKYPTAEIIQQERVGRFLLDFKVTVGETVKYIEFDGPSHFSIGRYGPPKKHPFDKKKLIEDATGIEVINWPYWIQRCTSNVAAIFETDKHGFGALWSTNIHFGDFYFQDSAKIIEQMSTRFGAWSDTGACDYYEENSRGRTKPGHPILLDIKNGKVNREKLLPSGAKEIDAWLPEIIRNNV